MIQRRFSCLLIFAYNLDKEATTQGLLNTHTPDRQTGAAAFSFRHAWFVYKIKNFGDAFVSLFCCVKSAAYLLLQLKLFGQVSYSYRYLVKIIIKICALVSVRIVC